MANDAFTGDNITIDVKVFRFVVGSFVGNIFNDLDISKGFVGVFVLLLVPDNVNFLFVVFGYVPVD